MDYGYTEHNNLQWTACYIEYLRIYHQAVKDYDDKFCLEPYSHITTVDLIEDQPLELVCDIRQCGGDSVNLVNWYLKDGKYIGCYYPSFGDSEVIPEYSNNMSIIYKEEKVILRISTYASSLQNSYCEFEADTTKTFCERKQTFKINVPGMKKNIFYKYL